MTEQTDLQTNLAKLVLTTTRLHEHDDLHRYVRTHDFCGINKWRVSTDCVRKREQPAIKDVSWGTIYQTPSCDFIILDRGRDSI